MENWKKQYKKNWAQIDDERKDKIWESNLKASIERNMELLKVKLSSRERLHVLEELANDFETLDLQSFDYNEKDYMFVKKQLAELRWELLKKDHMESMDSESWNEYEEEEKRYNDEERD